MTDEVLAALGSPARRRIVERLAAGPATMSQLAAVAGVTLPAIDKHVQVLAAAGLVRKTKTGRVATVHLVGGALRGLADWATTTEAMWRAGLARLGTYLEEQR